MIISEHYIKNLPDSVISTIDAEKPSNASYVRLDLSSLLGNHSTFITWRDDEDEETFTNPTESVYKALEPYYKDTNLNGTILIWL